MYKLAKLLFDSDALIKVTKAGFLEHVTTTFNVYITDDVYNEVVEEGKKRLYYDAEKIKNIIDNKKIYLIKNYSHIKRTEPKQSFGRGEISVFQAYNKDYVIVSDDLSFVLYLNKESIKNISSAHLLIALVKKGNITKEKAYYHLEKLKPLIRKEIFELVKNDIEGEQNESSTTIKNR